jgi:uncharacterized membrane protein
MGSRLFTEVHKKTSARVFDPTAGRFGIVVLELGSMLGADQGIVAEMLDAVAAEWPSHVDTTTNTRAMMLDANEFFLLAAVCIAAHCSAVRSASQGSDLIFGFQASGVMAFLCPRRA